MYCSKINKKGNSCSKKGIFAGCCENHAVEKIQKNLEGVKLKRIEKANDGKHKFIAVFTKNGKEWKHTPFGAAGMDDVTITKDLDQMARYQQRHMKDLSTHDPTRAGYLSMIILWWSPDMKENIRVYKEMFNL
jgi:hypothetical protein